MIRSRSAHVVRTTTFGQLETKGHAGQIAAVAWWAAIVAIACAFASFYVLSISMDAPLSGMLALLNGTAARPYVYRVLSTWLLQALVASGSGLTTGLWLIVSASFVGSVAATRYLAQSFEQYKARSMLITPVVVLAVAFLRISYPYDFLYDMPMLALSGLSFALMVRKSWAAYLAVFAVACLTKETAALLTVGFAFVYFRRTSWRQYIALGSAQVAIWMIVRVGVMLAFQNNPGSAMEFHMDRHLIALQRLPVAVAIYGVLTIAVLLVMFRGWSQKPHELRQLFIAIAPLMFALYIVGGSPFELRVFYEIVPVAVILLFSANGREIGI